MWDANPKDRDLQTPRQPFYQGPPLSFAAALPSDVTWSYGAVPPPPRSDGQQSVPTEAAAQTQAPKSAAPRDQRAPDAANLPLWGATAKPP